VGRGVGQGILAVEVVVETIVVEAVDGRVIGVEVAPVAAAAMVVEVAATEVEDEFDVGIVVVRKLHSE